jgi:hypothetical protein
MRLFADRLIATGFASPARIRGYSDKDVQDLEASWGRPLPLAYKEFLATMGAEAGDLFAGSDAIFADYRDLLKLHVWAEGALARRGNPFQLAEDEYVFAMHGGHQFWFFRTHPLDDDPPVSWWHWHCSLNRDMYPTLSTFLNSHLDSLVKCREQVEAIQRRIPKAE